ncbi:MAG: hypothetical protein GXO79_09520 [Chlorobi bacterium]|nr:hypothetical protein [Chlorobiota bacterium]
MENSKLNLLFLISFIIIVFSFSSCTFEYHSNSNDDEKVIDKSFKEIEVTENDSDETTDGQQLQKSNKSIKKVKADFVDVSIKARSGKLFINDGASRFVDAEFIYDKDELKPIMAYMENRERGDLTIDFTSKDDNHVNIDTDDDNTKCLLEFSNKIAMNMRIEFGAGQGKLNISDLDLEDIELRFGAGKFDIDLSNSMVKNIDIEAGFGEVNLDLSGKRNRNLNAEIIGGIGKLDVKLPKDTGVKVVVKGILGDIDAYGFIKNNKVYTNKAYGNSKYTIHLDVKAALGDVNLFLVD